MFPVTLSLPCRPKKMYFLNHFQYLPCNIVFLPTLLKFFAFLIGIKISKIFHFFPSLCDLSYIQKDYNFARIIFFFFNENNLVSRISGKIIKGFIHPLKCEKRKKKEGKKLGISSFCKVLRLKRKHLSDFSFDLEKCHVYRWENLNYLIFGKINLRHVHCVFHS